MQVREKLMNQFPKLELHVSDELPKGLIALYEQDALSPNGSITIDGRINYYLQNGILAEELGHHATSYGDITNYKGKNININAAKQEVRARRFGIKLILPLEKLVDCFENGYWGDLYAMCLYLEIDRSYFEEAIEDYKKQFGSYVKYDGYYIAFEPLKIEKL
ncbi:hypothetical protein ACFOU0_06585 [Salinicoccus sesuvii]|uniref:IrrE N-terminal-like domain-containing protein n=1 Tax=Salinicoccus sesuvii TaxID=868281 RepID=A0ABV7N6P1_9STAP